MIDMWSLDEAVSSIRELNVKIAKVGYCVGLTGGVLFRGKSDKDLDIVLYPLGSNLTPYMPALQETKNHFDAASCYGVTHGESKDDESTSKAIFVLKDRIGKRIDVFIPHVQHGQRNDPFMAIEHYGDETKIQ